MPLKKVPIPDTKNLQDRVVRSDEWNQLYKVAAPHFRPILLVAAQLGQRLGEILKPRWDRVDLQRGFITLRSSLRQLRCPSRSPHEGGVPLSIPPVGE